MGEPPSPAPGRPAPQKRTLREAWAAAWLNPDGTKKRTPMPALVLFLVLSGVMVPLVLFGNSQDRVYSADATATQSAGGETVDSSSSRNQGSTYVCRDAPVSFEAEDRRVEGVTQVSGECLAAGETRTISVRYDPDDPNDFTALGRQWILYGFAGAAALAFLVTLVAILRRLSARRKTG